MLNLTNMLMMIISIMVSMAFFTLMERKIISYSQTRKGPNKTSIAGIIQPMADAMKLLSKEVNLNYKSNFMIYMISPMMNILCSLTMWMIMPFMYTFNFMKMSILFMLSCMAMNMIFMMTMSWSSNSNYAYMGMMRAISQMISYEINLMMVLLIMINLCEHLSFSLMGNAQKYISFLILTFPLTVVWFIIILAETNRTPFDFSEGESELISGFNIEYSSVSFMMLFLAEYSNIIIMSYISVLIFSKNNVTSYTFYILFTATCYVFIWTRTSFPRFRYDKLMKFNWMQILPIMTFWMFNSFPFKTYCTMKSQN